MTEPLSRHVYLLDARDFDCRVALRALLDLRRRRGPLFEQDLEMERQLDELDREQQGER